MTIEIRSEGRRHYLVGDTYPHKDRLRAAGAHWDAERKAWWTGQRDVAERVVAEATAQAQATEAALPPASSTMVDVSGNTYPVRDRLRALGGRWVPEREVWQVPESRLAAAQAAVAAAPRDTYRPQSCRQCGARPGPRGWPRIYRSGVCSDCYRSEREDMGDYS